MFSIKSTKIDVKGIENKKYLAGNITDLFLGVRFNQNMISSDAPTLISNENSFCLRLAWST